MAASIRLVGSTLRIENGEEPEEAALKIWSAIIGSMMYWLRMTTLAKVKVVFVYMKLQE